MYNLSHYNIFHPLALISLIQPGTTFQIHWTVILALPGTMAISFWLEIMGSATQHNWGPICWKRLAEIFWRIHSCLAPLCGGFYLQLALWMHLYHFTSSTGFTPNPLITTFWSQTNQQYRKQEKLVVLGVHLLLQFPTLWTWKNSVSNI